MWPSVLWIVSSLGKCWNWHKSNVCLWVACMLSLLWHNNLPQMYSLLLLHLNSRFFGHRISQFCFFFSSSLKGWELCVLCSLHDPGIAYYCFVFFNIFIIYIGLHVCIYLGVTSLYIRAYCLWNKELFRGRRIV